MKNYTTFLKKCNIASELFENSKRNKFIEEYIRRGFSIIPLGNDKKPLISWKEYQNRIPYTEEVYKWCCDYPDFNIGIITGVGGFYSIDFDNKEALKFIPEELKQTMLTETARGFHLNYYSEKYFKGHLLSFGNYKAEFKGVGQYVVEPYSIINGFEYKAINSVSEIRQLPFLIIDLLARETEKELRQEPERWTFRGNANCIKQIFKRELIEGEREKSLFILYNLLIRNGNSPDYSKSLVVGKNRTLLKPLPEKELEYIFKEPYNNLGCGYVKSSLSFVDCGGCNFNKEVIKKMDPLKVIKDKRLSETDKAVALLSYVYEMNKTAIARELNKDRHEIYRSFERLKKAGYLGQNVTP